MVRPFRRRLVNAGISSNSGAVWDNGQPLVLLKSSSLLLHLGDLTMKCCHEN